MRSPAGAGIGPGTVHRHFPTKETLFEAVVVEHLEQLSRDARAALQADEDGSAFFAFLIRMTGETDAKQDLADAIAGVGAATLGSATLQEAADLREIFAALLRRAQRANVVRSTWTPQGCRRLSWPRSPLSANVPTRPDSIA
ncbi:TetR/AcrR family transcriptional regulator [Streptomyces sp. NPDC005500]|uniref:TetR/AcrR family transcriptional regulator n=1 Tax=Streptomyces sp. NPDC005500 TaxID=3155007 RepID=UPI0033A84DEC